MPFFSLSSTAPNTGAALDELASRFATEWTGGVDLAIVGNGLNLWSAGKREFPDPDMLPDHPC